MAAKTAFLTDPARKPVEYWWQELCAKVGVSLDLLREFAREEEWTRLRDRYWDDVYKSVIRRSKTAAITSRVQELQEIQQIRQDALELITPRVINGRKVYPVAPGSYEGMIRALAKLDEVLDAKRERILSSIDPAALQDAADGRAQQRSVSSLSSDELREVARFVLESRREKQLKRLERENEQSANSGNGTGECDPGVEGAE